MRWSSRPVPPFLPGDISKNSFGETVIYDGSKWEVVEPGDKWQGKVISFPTPPVPPQYTTPTPTIRVEKALPLKQQYVGGIRLIRGWTLAAADVTMSPRLRALTTTHLWEPGPQRAHTVPKLGGGMSGFFGFYDWAHADSELGDGVIWGTYIGWGRCVRGTMGFRCEYAQIDSIILDRGMFNRDGILWPKMRLMADYYGVPLLTKDEAKRLVLGIVPFTEEMKK